MEVPSRIRGILVSQAISWTSKTYGEGLLEKALARLAPDERRIFTSADLVVRWVDIPLFERLLDFIHAEVFIISGDSREVFDQKGLEGGGGRILKDLFLFVFSLVQPTQLLYRSISLRRRMYSSGSWTIIDNNPGKFVAEVKAPVDMNNIIMIEFKYGYSYLLRLANIKIKNMSIESKESNVFVYRLEYD